MSTKIAWTDETWNPVTGCTKVSPGCKHCYAEGVAERFWAKQYPRVPDPLRNRQAGESMMRPRVFTDVQCHPERLDIPLRWRKPRRVFVCSMSDLFHEAVPGEFIDRVFAAMALCPQHTFQVLTKRPERMHSYVSTDRRAHRIMDSVLGWHTKQEPNHYRLSNRLPIHPLQIAGDLRDRLHEPRWPLPNVWLGTTCENQEQLEARVPPLLRTPAAVRFLSLEPLLEAVDLRGEYLRLPNGRYPFPTLGVEHRTTYLDLLDWCICGGESGPKARPCDVAWIRSVVEQCKAAEVPCFVKQMGSYPVAGEAVLADWPTAKWRGDPATGLGRGILLNSKGADPAEWPEPLRAQEFPGAHEED